MEAGVSDDSVRRNLAKIDEAPGVKWRPEHWDAGVGPVRGLPGILDVNVTVKPLYGHPEGAVKGYNPHQPGRPSPTLHPYFMANLRWVRDVEAQAASAYRSPGRWERLGRLPRAHWSAGIRGDRDGGTEANRARAEQEGVGYLFKRRLTSGVKKTVERRMRQADGCDAGPGWQGAETTLRLSGWSRSRRAIVRRRRVEGELAVVDTGHPEPLRLSFAELTDEVVVYAYAVLVTSLSHEIRTIAPLYRDRGDAENPFDELKNQGGWGGFTTQDLKRCRFMARLTALTDNGWSLFVRLANPDQHTEAITSRPRLPYAPARLIHHGGQTRITLTHPHAQAPGVEQACREIAAFFKTLRQTAEPFHPLLRWYRVLSRALVKYLHGRQPHPPDALPAPA